MTTRSRKDLNGLAKCVEKVVLSSSDLANWKHAKEKREQFKRSAAS
jgi:hypothetical protein